MIKKLSSLKDKIYGEKTEKGAKKGKKAEKVEKKK